MSFLVLGLLLALLAVLFRGKNRDRPHPLVLLFVYLLPAFFLVASLVDARDRATRLRFALLGLGFRAEEGKTLEVSVGGDRKRHDVWVSALGIDVEPPVGGQSAQIAQAAKAQPAGFFLFQPRDGTLGTLTVVANPGADTGLLAVREAGTLVPVRAVPLADGDGLGLGGKTWQVQTKPGLFGPPARFVSDGGLVVPLRPRPRSLNLRLFSLPLPSWRARPPSLETYPATGLVGLGGLDEGEEGAFFFRTPRLFSRDPLWLAPSQSGPTVRRGGSRVEPTGSRPLSAGERVYVVSRPPMGEGFVAGGLRDRRSFRSEAGERGFVLSFDTPEIYVLTEANLKDLDLTSPDKQAGADTVRVNLSFGSWQLSDKSLYLRHASERLGAQAFATLELPRHLGGWRFSNALATTTPTGHREESFGRPLWLGRDLLAAVQFDRLEPPLALAALAVALAFAKALAARSARLTALQLLFAGVLEALVSLRLLLGFRAWALPPFSEESFRLALVAWALLPWGFLALAVPPPDPHRLRPRFGSGQVLLVAGWLFALLWTWRFGGGGARSLLWVGCQLGVLLFATGRALALGQHLPARLRDRFHALADPEVTGPRVWLGLSLVPLAIRFLALLAGGRESLVVGGQRFALSLVHVPLAIVLEAGYLLWLWNRSRQRSRLGWGDLAPALAFLFATWLVPGLLAEDLGLALLNVPVFLLALAVTAAAVRRGLRADGVLAHSRWPVRAPLLLVAAYLAFAVLPVGARAVLSFLPVAQHTELASEREFLRLLAVAYPERLGALGSRKSEDLAVMSAVMRSYTGGPFFGRGYLTSELSPHLAATTLREHATAVFLAAEWGLAGSLGAMALYAVACLCGLRVHPLRPAAWRSFAGWSTGGAFGRLASLLAALTFGVASLYMIIANYQVTFFTGKNVYLLGLDSAADVLEAFLLAAVFALGSALEDMP